MEKIIVNADDFGKTHTINLAIAECFNKGLITNTTIMVNMPFADEAVEIAKQEGFFDKVGLHINLTEGVMISGVKNSTIENEGILTGSFNESIKGRMLLPKEEKILLGTEIDSQIKRYIEYGFSEFHMDSHCHVHTGLSVYSSYKALFKKYGFRSCRLSRNIAIDNINPIVKAYKSVLNYDMKKFVPYTSDLFGGFSDFKNYINSESGDKRRTDFGKYNKREIIIELMCHPDFDSNGNIVNLYAGEGLEKELPQFFNKYIKLFELISYMDLPTIRG